MGLGHLTTKHVKKTKIKKKQTQKKGGVSHLDGPTNGGDNARLELLHVVHLAHEARRMTTLVDLQKARAPEPPRARLDDDGVAARMRGVVVLEIEHVEAATVGNGYGSVMVSIGVVVVVLCRGRCATHHPESRARREVVKVRVHVAGHR